MKKMKMCPTCGMEMKAETPAMEAKEEMPVAKPKAKKSPAKDLDALKMVMKKKGIKS